MNEELVRELLAEEARAVTVDADLLGAVAVLRARRRRRSAQRAGLALALALVVVAIAVPLSLRHPTGREVASAGPGVAVTSAPPPAGTRAVTFGGITVDVPASWGTDQLACGTPAADTVWYAFGVFPSCARIYPPGSPGSLEHPFSTLELASSDLTAVTDSTVPAPEIVFAGLPAQEAGVYSGDGPAITEYVYVPSRHVSFAVTAPNRAAAEQILATAHLSTEYDGGCATAQPAGLPVVRGGSAAGRQMLGRPASLALCDYAHGWLLTGAELTGTSLSRLVAAIEATPAGYTGAERAAQQAGEPATCSDIDTVVLQVPADVREAADFTSAARELVIRTRACGGHAPGVAANTGEQTALTASLLDALFPLLPTAIGSSYSPDALAQPTAG